MLELFAIAELAWLLALTLVEWRTALSRGTSRRSTIKFLLLATGLWLLGGVFATATGASAASHAATNTCWLAVSSPGFFIIVLPSVVLTVLVLVCALLRCALHFKVRGLGRSVLRTIFPLATISGGFVAAQLFVTGAGRSLIFLAAAANLLQGVSMPSLVWMPIPRASLCLEMSIPNQLWLTGADLYLGRVRAIVSLSLQA